MVASETHVLVDTMLMLKKQITLTKENICISLKVIAVMRTAQLKIAKTETQLSPTVFTYLGPGNKTEKVLPIVSKLHKKQQQHYKTSIMIKHLEKYFVFLRTISCL